MLQKPPGSFQILEVPHIWRFQVIRMDVGCWVWAAVVSKGSQVARMCSQHCEGLTTDLDVNRLDVFGSGQPGQDSISKSTAS